MADAVEVKFMGLSGDLLTKCCVPHGLCVGQVRQELAQSLAFPLKAVRLLDAGAPVEDSELLSSPRLFTCVLTAEDTLEDFRRAVAAGRHAFLRAVLQVADADSVRRLLLGHVDWRYPALQQAIVAERAVEVLEVLVSAARGAGCLEECLLHLPEAATFLRNGKVVYGEAALHVAAARGKKAVLARLLAEVRREGLLRRALLQRSPMYGRSALHCAAGRPAAQRLLLAAAEEEGLRAQVLALRDERWISAKEAVRRGGLGTYPPTGCLQC